MMTPIRMSRMTGIQGTKSGFADAAVKGGEHND